MQITKVKLAKFEPLTYFEIWQPRWHDKTVLLKAIKVKNATTKYIKIKFTKTPSMPDAYVISKAKVMSYPKETNGMIPCYVVPIKDLGLLEIDEKDIRGLI